MRHHAIQLGTTGSEHLGNLEQLRAIGLDAGAMVIRIDFDHDLKANIIGDAKS